MSDPGPLLPPLGLREDMPPAPGADVVNPGSVSPMLQQRVSPSYAVSKTSASGAVRSSNGEGQYPAPSHRPMVTIASASAVESSGNVQLKNLHAGQQGVRVSSGPGLAKESTGQRQLRTRSRLDQGTTVTEIPRERGRLVHADSQAHVFLAPDVAPLGPPGPVDVQAGSGRPGGLPVNVNVVS